MMKDILRETKITLLAYCDVIYLHEQSFLCVFLPVHSSSGFRVLDLFQYCFHLSTGGGEPKRRSAVDRYPFTCIFRFTFECDSTIFSVFRSADGNQLPICKGCFGSVLPVGLPGNGVCGPATYNFRWIFPTL